MTTDIMDIADAATYLQIKKGTLYRLVKSGRIPGTKIGGQWRFKRDVLDHLFDFTDKGDRRTGTD